MKANKIVKSIFQIVFLLILCIPLHSCDSSLVFEKNKSFQDNNWNKDSLAVFTFKTDSIYSKEISFAICLRNTVDYQYRNLWVFMDLQIPNQPLKRDTLNLSLMNEQGYWEPYVTGSRIKESKHLYRYKVRNPPSGEYKISLQQAMRTDNLSEIVSIGARIQKIE